MHGKMKHRLAVSSAGQLPLLLAASRVMRGWVPNHDRQVETGEECPIGSGMTRRREGGEKARKRAEKSGKNGRETGGNGHGK